MNRRDRLLFRGCFLALAVANACVDPPRTSRPEETGGTPTGGARSGGAAGANGVSGGREAAGGSDVSSSGGTASGGHMAGGPTSTAGEPSAGEGGAGAGGVESDGGSSGSDGASSGSGGAAKGGASDGAAAGATPTGGVGGAIEAGSGGEPNGGDANAGAPGIPSVDCPASELLGWASVSGLDFDAPTSGGTGDPVTVTTADELQSYASSPDPRVIVISGNIAIPALDVTSNKTIRGADRSAKISGGIRVMGTSTASADSVKNVVIQNLTIDASGSDTSTEPDEDDGITLAYAHHVWIDHVDIVDAPGDDIDVTRGSDYVTISWSKVRFLNGSRKTGVRIGHSDTNDAEDAGHLKVTLHHNYWGETVSQRMPRVRFGDVHVFDNYYGARGDTYCVGAALDSRLLVENNYFDGSLNPHVFFSFNGSESVFAEPTAEMVVNGNTYVGDSNLATGKQSGQGPSFVPEYTVSLEPADESLKTVVSACAGPH